ncbi:hypothetical protein [Halarsenatibacter silvermanii]|uniref:hypothetical protein n=1 Tax=Halarsenatibacter silvermanii TaxID=321763 RepID=UPI0013566749|nr:hypothetical protein [Halarsenatibacter silvermanii]
MIESLPAIDFLVERKNKMKNPGPKQAGNSFDKSWLNRPVFLICSVIKMDRKDKMA